MIPDNVEKIIMTKEDYDRNVEQVILERNDYEERIQKAINKMQYIMSLGFDYDGFNNVNDFKKLIDELVNIAIESVDILIGEDNE